VAVVQYTFTHKQYIEQHNRHKQYIEQDSSLKMLGFKLQSKDGSLNL